MNGKFLSWTCLQLLLLLLLPLLPGHAASRSIVKTLPGLSGDLPFKLETGYVSVEESELFYYFVESQGDPEIDPLILYINGGPGCSGLNGFLYQIGPLAFNTTKYKGGLPALILYPYSWTKTSSIIFLDAPVGAGFSYARSAEGYNVSDKSSASQAYEFLRKWLKEHRNFITNQLFIGGDSYSGLITPIIAQEILNGNEAGLKPRLNLKGYVIGSPHANQELQDNAQIPYAHRMALISDRLYESAKRNCKGNYVNIDPSNPKCLEDLEAIQERIGQVPVQNILYPKCATLSPKPDEEQVRRSLNSNDFWCWNFDYLLSDMWANDKRVQNALHVRKGTVKEWFRCNASLTASYTYDVHNAIGYHENLTKTGLQVLLFSGDHDMLIPHSFVEDWIKSLDVPVDSSWRPWFVDGQVAGYTVKYKNIGYRLTYATVKGAGHSPKEFKRRECYEMFERWIHYYPL